MNIQNYLNERVENQIQYFNNKSGLNKNYYQLFKNMQLVAAALLPFFSIFLSDYLWMKYIVALLGTGVTILEGILSTGKYHEKWVSYRATAESLIQEKFLFLMQAGGYNEENAAQQFVAKVELLLGKENSSWQQMIVKEKEKNSNDNGKNNGITELQNPKPKKNEEPPANNDVKETEEEVQPSPIDPLTGIKNDTEEEREQQ